MKKLIDRIFLGKKQLELTVGESNSKTELVFEEAPQTKEEMILKTIRGLPSFGDVVRFMASDEHAYFDCDSVCGKQILKTLADITKKRAMQCATFLEAYSVYSVELEPVSGPYSSYCNYWSFIMTMYRRVRDLADQQLEEALSKGDLHLLQKLYEESKVVKGFEYFESTFENAIQVFIGRKLEGVNDIDSLVEIYKSTEEANCDFAGEIVKSAISEFVLKNQGVLMQKS